MTVHVSVKIGILVWAKVKLKLALFIMIYLWTPQYLTSAFRGNKITHTFFQAFSLDSDTH